MYAGGWVQRTICLRTLRKHINAMGGELIAWIDNALDETVADVDSTLNLYAGDNSYQSFLQPPRSFGLTFRINY